MPLAPNRRGTRPFISRRPLEDLVFPRCPPSKSPLSDSVSFLWTGPTSCIGPRRWTYLSASYMSDPGLCREAADVNRMFVLLRITHSKINKAYYHLCEWLNKSGSPIWVPGKEEWVGDLKSWTEKAQWPLCGVLGIQLGSSSSAPYHHHYHHHQFPGAAQSDYNNKQQGDCMGQGGQHHRPRELSWQGKCPYGWRGVESVEGDARKAGVCGEFLRVVSSTVRRYSLGFLTEAGTAWPPKSRQAPSLLLTSWFPGLFSPR